MDILGQQDPDISYQIGALVGWFLMAVLLAYLIVRVWVRLRTGDPGAAKAKANSWRTAVLAIPIMLIAGLGSALS